MKVYGNSLCIGCHQPIVCRDLTTLDGYARCALEHTPDCPEWAAVPKLTITVSRVTRMHMPDETYDDHYDYPHGDGSN